MDSQAIEDLNALLKDELASLGAYAEVLKKIDKKDSAVGILEQCRDSHQGRAAKLRQAVTKFGGEPIAEIGLGGKFAKLIIDGAATINDETMIAALGEDEGGWSSDYEWRLVNMHGDHRQLVKDELWPQQQQTEEKMRELVKSINKGLWPAAPGTKDI